MGSFLAVLFNIYIEVGLNLHNEKTIKEIHVREKMTRGRSLAYSRAPPPGGCGFVFSSLIILSPEAGTLGPSSTDEPIGPAPSMRCEAEEQTDRFAQNSAWNEPLTKGEPRPLDSQPRVLPDKPGEERFA